MTLTFRLKAGAQLSGASFLSTERSQDMRMDAQNGDIDVPVVLANSPCLSFMSVDMMAADDMLGMGLLTFFFRAGVDSKLTSEDSGLYIFHKHHTSHNSCRLESECSQYQVPYDSPKNDDLFQCRPFLHVSSKD